MHPVLRLGRAGNAALAAIGAAVGALAAHPEEAAVAWWPIVAAAAAAFLGTFGGNALNDLRDRDLDRTAHPARPLPSGALRPRTAAVLVAVSWTAALALAATVGVRLLAFTAALLLLLVVYETMLKARGLVGNLAVAAAAGALFPYGAVAVGGDLRLASMLGGLALLAHFGRELHKDAEDADADRAVRDTFAVAHGPRSAAGVAALALVAAVLLSVLPAFWGPWPMWYLLAVAPADAAFLAAAALGPRDPARARGAAKLGMVLATAAFAAAALG